MVGVTFCTCLSTIELAVFPPTMGDKWLGLAGRAGLGVELFPGLLGSLGVLAGELFVLEYFLTPGVTDGLEDLGDKSSSDFFLPVLLIEASNEFDLERGLEYRLDVDLALVSPGLDPPDPYSNNFLVCFTISGAGSSLSLTPNNTPVDALLEPGPFAFTDDFGLMLLLLLLLDPAAAVGLNGFGCVKCDSLGGGCFSAMITLSLTRAGLCDKTLWTLGLSLVSLGGNGGGLSLGGGWSVPSK